MTDQPPTLLQQRLVAAAILGGALLFAVLVPFLLPEDGGGLADPPIPVLDYVAVGVGASMLIVVQVVRGLLQQHAANAPPEQAASAQFTVVLVPLALLEGSMMFSCVAWMLNGTAVPNAAVFAVLFARGLMLVPGRGEAA